MKDEMMKELSEYRDRIRDIEKCGIYNKDTIRRLKETMGIMNLAIPNGSFSEKDARKALTIYYQEKKYLEKNLVPLEQGD